ncbi:MAG: glycosyltransferase family 2 protein [Candidatus Omnitrophota bacterium]|nr:MAG: glycosyltransferase family 2 protein [Candidatus Omnitrophota bacterium]
MKNIRGKKISIIMPAFNEAGHIGASLDETVRTFSAFNCDYEIVVIDDGSSDDTYKNAKQNAEKYPQGLIIVKRTRSNYGKGRALKKGFRYTKGDYIIFLDADMDLHPGQIDTFFDIMQLTETDVVIGSKRHPNSVVFFPWHRRVMSLFYFFLIKIMFGLPIKDTQTGLKLFKRKVLTDVFPKVLILQFAFALELLANAHLFGYKIAEAPVYITSQRDNTRIGILTIYKMCVDTISIYYRFLKTRIKYVFKKKRVG